MYNVNTQAKYGKKNFIYIYIYIYTHTHEITLMLKHFLFFKDKAESCINIVRNELNFLFTHGKGFQTLSFKHFRMAYNLNPLCLTISTITVRRINGSRFFTSNSTTTTFHTKSMHNTSHKSYTCYFVDKPRKDLHSYQELKNLKSTFICPIYCTF